MVRPDRQLLSAGLETRPSLAASTPAPRGDRRHSAGHGRGGTRWLPPLRANSPCKSRQRPAACSRSNSPQGRGPGSTIPRTRPASCRGAPGGLTAQGLGSSAPCSKALPTATAVLLAEHTFQFNRHTSRSRGQFFDRLLKPALHTEPIPWQHSSTHPAMRPLQLSADPEHLRQSLAQPGLVRVTEVIGARLPQG